MKRIMLIVPLLLVAVACGKSSPTTSPTAAPTTAASATPFSTSTTVKKTDNPTKGKILTTPDGRSLYEFDNDTSGKSNCEGQCATTWPPLTFTGNGAPTGAAGLSTITRTDGTKQVALDGHPLYMYSGDTKAGDTNGDGLFGKWHLAKATH
jgi:predicted lipoprotein with Yx(FWY)xxD motif